MSEELKGRTVECGSCEKRFQVTEGVIAHERDRFYPDEIRKKADLSRFGRAPISSAPVEFRTMEYGKIPKQPMIGPAPPARNFALVGGLLVLILTALAFYLGAENVGGFLQDVEKPQRYVLAGFFGLLGFGLLTWGNIRKPILGAFIGLLGMAGLLAMAYYLPVHRSATAVGSANEFESSVIGDQSEKEEAPAFFPGITEEKLTPQQVMRKTRWESAVLPLVSRGDENQVAAIWVRSMEEFHNLQIRKYLQQELELPIRPDFRTLSDGGIFVLSGIPLDLDQVEFVAERFGEIEQVIPELRLIQMQVNPTVLGEVSNELTSKLSNPDDGAFYSLNYAELIALDRGRVKLAIKRLATAEPIRMRKDITVRLVGLLSEKHDPETLGDLAKAIEVWSEEGDGADRIVADMGTRMRLRGQPVPDEILRFVAERKTPTAASMMVDLWAESPVTRQSYLESYGSQAAPLVEPFLRSEEVGMARSAAIMLGKIGTSSQLPAMQEALAESSDDELKLVLEEAIKRVSQR
ncbi:HEAT repeat domain-containing protein [Roseibacillus persicicus]|uniref:HEAT repeat domain-containing protein n=1 Tax=Roseibacillus persicicus TaxID=454148 RepID=UPI00280C4D4F|nr:HEAT repeat domain-containing protein [Roseibacillus persicicus]MDQ8191187.1 HEAT repeat domain-containing protein [Roseibacillus persicicus]